MEIASIIRWVCLAFAFIAALFSVLTFVSLRDPKKFIIESNEQFTTDLYDDFTNRLINDPAFMTKAKEAIGA